MGFFKLNIEKMAKNRDIKGLAKALLDRKDLDVRNDAAQALDDMTDIGKITDQQFADLLVKAKRESYKLISKTDLEFQSKLKNSDHYIRFTADLILHKMGAEVIEPMVKAITDDLDELSYTQKMELRKSSAFVIQQKGDMIDNVIVEQLVSSLSSTDETVVRCSAIALASIKNDRVTEALIHVLRSPKTFHYGEVAEALEQIQDPRAIEPLIEAVQLGANAPEFAKALVNLGDHQVVEPLLNVLKSYIGKDNDYDQPSSIIYSLSLLKDARTIEPFIAFLSHQSNYEKGSEFTRASLARALGDIGDGSAVAILARTLNTDPNQSVRYTAATALGDLAGRGKLDPMVEIARISLQAAAATGTADIKDASIKALARFPKKVDVKPIAEANEHLLNQSSLLEEQLSNIIKDYAEFAMIEEIAKILVDLDRKSNKEVDHPAVYEAIMESIKQVGTKLNKVGGESLMIKVLDQAGYYGCNKRFIEREWDGIGSWQG